MAESTKDKSIVPQTDALGRKVWDKEYFAKRALLRQYEDGADVEDDESAELLDVGQSRKKARKEVSFPSERRPLEQRKEVVQLDVELGKSKIVTTHTPKQQQGGYWCDVCECLIKDSQAYLDHINGKRHNRLLGMVMRVEKVGVDRVHRKINQVKQEKEKQAELQQQISDYGGIETRLLEAEKEEKARRKERREQRRRKKKEKKNESRTTRRPQQQPEEDEEEYGESDEGDPRSTAPPQDSAAAIAARIRQMFEEQGGGGGGGHKD